ncbi:putative trichothecene 3-O-acetyltransferase [Halenospora varia]|nr:putative trichothecene 3-O-acetyltransferase [Halenospora varia]
MDGQNDTLDILGQQPALNLYTQICFCFPVQDDTSLDKIVTTLKSGLERLSASFPWVAGQVVNEGANDGNTGIFKIKPLEKTPRLIIEDLRNDASMPTMEFLRTAKFPFRMLDENVICPRNTIPGTSNEPPYEDIPVFLLQANFIIGGLLLTFNGQHQTMDMTGQGQIIDLFSKACRNEEFTPEELLTGNLARHDLIPLFDDSWTPGSELAASIIPPKSEQPSTGTEGLPAPPGPPSSSWAYLNFSSTSLLALKTHACNTLTSGFVSTDDTITAFIWQCVVRARAPRLASPEREVHFARAIDVRKFLNVPAEYPGLLQNMTYHSFPLQKLISSPLGVVASNLRTGLNATQVSHHTRSLATYFSRTPNKNCVSFTAALDLSADIMFSSWAKLDCYELDFGLGLGMPECVRRPQLIPVESLGYLMPKDREGGIAVAICLRDDDMKRLRGDEELLKYGEFIA